MIYGTRAEVALITEFLRRIQLSNPDLNIQLHDLARELESLMDQSVDGAAVTSHVAVAFRDGGAIRLGDDAPAPPVGSDHALRVSRARTA